MRSYTSCRLHRCCHQQILPAYIRGYLAQLVDICVQTKTYARCLGTAGFRFKTLRSKPLSAPVQVACISQLKLHQWSQMAYDDIRFTINRPGKRLLAAFRRAKNLLQHLNRLVELAGAGDSSLPHLLPPSWEPVVTAVARPSLLGFSLGPCKLNAALLPAIQIWRAQFNEQLQMLRIHPATTMP